MGAFSGLFLPFVLLFLGCVVAVAVGSFWWTVRARNIDRMQMKRHVQERDMRGSA
jgi:hypothetical protein